AEQGGGVAGDLQDLRPGLHRRAGRIDADDIARTSVRDEANHHAGMRGTGDRAYNYVVEPEAHLRLLMSHLLGETDIAEAAELVHRGASGNCVRLATPRFDFLECGGPACADADVEAFLHQTRLGAHDAR